jgi:DNA-binding response OmpR family regulator
MLASMIRLRIAITACRLQLDNAQVVPRQGKFTHGMIGLLSEPFFVANSRGNDRPAYLKSTSLLETGNSTMITTCASPDSTHVRRFNTKFRLLIIDEDSSHCDAISTALRNAGCRIDRGHFDDDGQGLSGAQNYAAIIVDLVKPVRGALELIRQVRRDHADSAILVLTGKHDFQTRISALERGADDYLAGPFSTEPLLDRLLTVIFKKRADDSRKITIGDLTIDAERRLAARGGRQIDLTRREFELLRYLAMHSGEIVSRSEIREHVFNGDGEPTSNIVDVYIRYLRKKMEFSGKPKLLKTFHGRGYMLGHPGAMTRELAGAGNDAHPGPPRRRTYLS